MFTNYNTGPMISVYSPISSKGGKKTKFRKLKSKMRNNKSKICNNKSKKNRTIRRYNKIK